MDRVASPLKHQKNQTIELQTFKTTKSQSLASFRLLPGLGYTPGYSGGNTRRIIPPTRQLVLLLTSVDYGILKSGLFLIAHEDYPVTQGFLHGFPKNMTYIYPRYPELKHGSHIIFRRYAAKLVDYDHFQNPDLDMPQSEGIYLINVDDIEAIIEDNA